MLLPTDHNKLLMQWKGPYEVSAVVGINDYKVRVKDKVKVYHANLLKKYIERKDELGEAAAASVEGLVTSMSCSGEPSELELDPDVDNTDFLEIDRYVAKESIADVKTGPGLNYWDDILVHTRTWGEHLKILRELFRCLAQAKMTIRPSKCIFGVGSIDFLGHQLQQE